MANGWTPVDKMLVWQTRRQAWISFPESSLQSAGATQWQMNRSAKAKSSGSCQIHVEIDIAFTDCLGKTWDCACPPLQGPLQAFTILFPLTLWTSKGTESIDANIFSSTTGNMLQTLALLHKEHWLSLASRI